MYSSISSKTYIVKKINEWTIFVVGEIWREENKHNLQIRHVAASTPRVNQGVQPWVSQRPLASHRVKSVMRAAYRELTADDYVILWPPSLTEFNVG
jgi:hypothetical protein